MVRDDNSYRAPYPQGQSCLASDHVVPRPKDAPHALPECDRSHRQKLAQDRGGYKQVRSKMITVDCAFGHRM